MSMMRQHGILVA